MHIGGGETEIGHFRTFQWLGLDQVIRHTIV